MAELDFTQDELLDQARGNQSAFWHLALRRAREQSGSVDDWARFIGSHFAPSWDDLGEDASALDVARLCAFNLATTADMRPLQVDGDSSRAEVIVEGPKADWLSRFATTREDSDRANELIFRAIAERRGLTVDVSRDDVGLWRREPSAAVTVSWSAFGPRSRTRATARSGRSFTPSSDRRPISQRRSTGSRKSSANGGRGAAPRRARPGQRATPNTRFGHRSPARAVPEHVPAGARGTVRLLATNHRSRTRLRDGHTTHSSFVARRGVDRSRAWATCSGVGTVARPMLLPRRPSQPNANQ